jgi:hypothetical protein
MALAGALGTPATPNACRSRGRRRAALSQDVPLAAAHRAERRYASNGSLAGPVLPPGMGLAASPLSCWCLRVLALAWQVKLGAMGDAPS